jgi:hypothetical protein
LAVEDEDRSLAAFAKDAWTAAVRAFTSRSRFTTRISRALMASNIARAVEEARSFSSALRCKKKKKKRRRRRRNQWNVSFQGSSIRCHVSKGCIAFFPKSVTHFA